MIFDVIDRSLRQRSRLIPVEALVGNCDGSRMPEILADRLTSAIAQRLIDVCPTRALGIEEYQSHRCLRLSYGRCIGCGKCVEAGQGSVIAAKRFNSRGVAKVQTVRFYDIDGHSEITCKVPISAEAKGQIHSLLQRALNVRQLDA